MGPYLMADQTLIRGVIKDKYLTKHSNIIGKSVNGNQLST